MPPRMFFALGGALVGAAGLDLLFTYGSPFALAGELESVGFALAGLVVLTIGLVRRRRGPHRGSSGPSWPGL